MSGTLDVRRAKPTDLQAIGGLVDKATQSRYQPNKATLVDWLLSRGLWLALENGTPVGVAAWQAENLVSVIDVFYIPAAGPLAGAVSQLLSKLEAEARTLMCEVSIVVLPDWTSGEVATLLRRQGYQQCAPGDLHRIWQQVLSEFSTDQRVVLVKPLRGELVIAPL